ncbi:substrate-binding domain-containing protein [Glutamicibacter mishrai]|uniref:substrate-binding domain-containing protein n=1 Tax=Glutamicibacter mishrai TaxID=1775880 RepID=UPI0007493614|nr:substrate-binding domain-containing protein [Glutamicibacter mishrai]KUM29812.1 D-ribose ABC transporter substrate-binding protein [Arthrobacter sp. EpRS66]UTT39135.1 substrate-binding domain-containing protein [Glutamicibacter mishrai]
MKKLIRTTAAITLSLGLAASLAACNRGENAADGASVTLAVSTLNNPFFVDLRDGAQKEADAQGIDLSVVDAQNDSATQANQLATAATNGSAGVIINAVDTETAEAGLAPVVKAELPIVAVDRAVGNTKIASFVASDNVAGGEQAAKALAESIDGKGKIIVLEGVPGASATNERGEGFTKGLKEFKDIEVVSKQTANFDRAEALDVVTNLMQSNPDAVGVLAMNDEMALGAIQALGDKAGKDVKVVGFDGTDDGFKAVEAGTMVATIAQNPAELGKQSVQILSKSIKGEEVEANVQVAVDTVDEKNVAEYAGE